MQKGIIIGLLTIITVGLTGCQKPQIFKTDEPNYAVEVTDKKMEQDTYYVKNGTRFAKVYLPNGNVTTTSGKVNLSRVMYFSGDEAKVPVHYKGELIAYASKKADLDKVILERFKDMDYSIGVYGGKLEGDGYYHVSVSKSTIVPGSSADEIFGETPSKEIRIVSIAGTPVKELVDEGSGILLKMEKDQSYAVEFYAGTYFFRSLITADTHFIRSYEIYSYGSEWIEDTTHGYMCFNTPNSLKSGWYLINGQGLFQYQEKERGAESEEKLFLNDQYYKSTEETVAAYSKQYKAFVPSPTKDMRIQIPYGDITDVNEEGADITGYIVAPDGTTYSMQNDTKLRLLYLELAQADAGDWMVYIYPKSLTIGEITVNSLEVQEETSCEEQSFKIETDTKNLRFYADVGIYADVVGSADIMGVVISPTGQTFKMSIGEFKEGKLTKHYLKYDMPYVKEGEYTIKVYHYQSQTLISNMQIIPYEDDSNEILIVD